MEKVLERRKGVLAIVLVLLLVAFSLVATIDMSYAGNGGDEGIGDPADDLLQPELPTGMEGTSSYVELLILLAALDFVL